jgi:uncharacterized protein
MKLSRYHVASPPVIDQATGEVKRVIFATRTAEPRIIGDAAWQLIEAGQFDHVPTDVLIELTDIELLVPDSDDELDTILRRNEAAATDDDNLYLVVQPTAWCQLGCGYCGQEHIRRHLNQENQERFIERARSKLAERRYKTLELTWFGGEPLVGMHVIRSMTPRLLALADEFGVDYHGRLVTNGVLLTELNATELVKRLGVNYIEVTLDGTAPFHDARRHTKKGESTFEQIFANVVRLAKRDDLNANLTLRCNVDRRNFNGVSPLLRMLADEGVQKRLAFYVAPIHSWGNDAHLESLSNAEFAEWEIRWFVEMIELGFSPSLLPKRRPIVCFAVQPNAELVDAHGELFNCTEVSYVPRYGKPNVFAIGNLASGEVDGKRRVLGDFNQHVRREEYACHACRMLPVCGGRCPKLWLEGIVPCPSPKFNIETRLLLKLAMSRLQAGPAIEAPVGATT